MGDGCRFQHVPTVNLPGCFWWVVGDLQLGDQVWSQLESPKQVDTWPISVEVGPSTRLGPKNRRNKWGDVYIAFQLAAWNALRVYNLAAICIFLGGTWIHRVTSMGVPGVISPLLIIGVGYFTPFITIGYNVAHLVTDRSCNTTRDQLTNLAGFFPRNFDTYLKRYRTAGFFQPAI